VVGKPQRVAAGRRNRKNVQNQQLVQTSGNKSRVAAEPEQVLEGNKMKNPVQ